MPSRVSKPPLIGRLLLRARRLGDRRDEVEADLFELYAARVAERGRLTASWRYCTDAISLWRVRDESGAAPASFSLEGSTYVMRQDMVFALRLFRRRAGLFGIGIAGLALAIGLSTATFSLVFATAFRGYGIAAPASVFRVLLTTGF